MLVLKQRQEGHVVELPPRYVVVDHAVSVVRSHKQVHSETRLRVIKRILHLIFQYVLADPSV